MKTRLALLLCLVGVSGSAQSAGTFTATGSMITPRFGHMATLLPNGKVLIAGGVTICFLQSQPCIGPNSAELYDPSTRAFTATGAMNIIRPIGGVLLPNGKVLFAESYNVIGVLASVELYDPTDGVFNSAGNAATLAALDSATLLNDGRVLLTGWSNQGGGAEIYDPVAETFSPVDDWPPDSGFVPYLALLLPDGRVLLATADSMALYDPVAGAFTKFSAWAFNDTPPAVLLPDGQVLVTGGNTDCCVNVNWAELLDPAAGAFIATGGMSSARDGHTASLLPDGTVLVAGGGTNIFDSATKITLLTASAELFDPAGGSFSPTGWMTTPRLSHAAVLLNNGQVLVTGGQLSSPPEGPSRTFTGSSSAELYTAAVLIPAPTLFSLSGGGQGQGAIWHAATGQVASSQSPAVAGEILSMYTTRLMEGGVIPPQVAIGGKLAQILFFGDAPGYPGYYQVNFRVPSSVAPGPAVPLRLTYIGRPSNEVTIGVQ